MIAAEPREDIAKSALWFSAELSASAYDPGGYSADAASPILKTESAPGPGNGRTMRA